MTEPPRPPGAGDPDPTWSDPTAPLPPPASTPSSGQAAPGPPPGHEPPGHQAGQPGPYPPSGPTPGGYPPPAAPSGAGGYPPGGYPPPGGGSGPGYPSDATRQFGGGFGAGPTPGGYANNEDRTWALLAHALGPAGVVVGAGLLGWVGPLIAMMARGQQSTVVRVHSVAALNFQITWAIAFGLAWILTLVTCGLLFFLPAIIWVIPVVFGIIGAVKANEGVVYRYPMSYPFVKR